MNCDHALGWRTGCRNSSRRLSAPHEYLKICFKYYAEHRRRLWNISLIDFFAACVATNVTAWSTWSKNWVRLGCSSSVKYCEQVSHAKPPQPSDSSAVWTFPLCWSCCLPACQSGIV